jgi:hypothetical protein
VCERDGNAQEYTALPSKNLFKIAVNLKLNTQRAVRRCEPPESSRSERLVALPAHASATPTAAHHSQHKRRSSIIRSTSAATHLIDM